MMASAPDLIEPLLGYRYFLVDQGRLLSPVWSLPRQVFAPGRNRARCPYRHRSLTTWIRRGRRHQPQQPIPAADCSCGLYAHHRLDRLPTYGYLGQTVAALVRAPSGLVELYRDGFRAAELELVALAPLSPLEATTLDELSLYYQVPVVALPQLDHCASGQGRLLGAELRDELFAGGPVPDGQLSWSLLRLSLWLLAPVALGLGLGGALLGWGPWLLALLALPPVAIAGLGLETALLRRRLKREKSDGHRPDLASTGG